MSSYYNSYSILFIRLRSSSTASHLLAVFRFPFPFLRHQFITMPDEFLYQLVRQMPEEVKLVPMLLVHVPCGSYLGVTLAKFQSPVWVALQYEPLCPLQVNHGKYLATDAKCQRRLVKGKVLRCLRHGQTEFTYTLYVHKITDSLTTNR